MQIVPRASWFYMRILHEKVIYKDFCFIGSSHLFRNLQAMFLCVGAYGILSSFLNCYASTPLRIVDVKFQMYLIYMIEYLVKNWERISSFHG